MCIRDSNLDSEMVASDLVTQSDEKPEKWDLSEAISHEDSERLKSFFDERSESLQRSSSSLNMFNSIPVQRLQKQVTRASPSTESSPRKGSLHHLTHKNHSMPNLRPPKYFDTDEPSSPSAIVASPAQEPLIISSPLSTEDHSTTSINLLKSILKKEWSKSPLPANALPLPAVVIYAAFIHTKLFQDQVLQSYEYNEIFFDFFENYKTATIVSNSTTTDKFIVTIYLIALIKSTPTAVESRVTDATTKLSEYCTQLMVDIVDPVLPIFENITQEFVSCLLDMTQLANELNHLIKTAEKSLPLEEPAKTFFHNYLISVIDMKTVQQIAASPYSCTFLSAAQWNSLSTVMVEKSISLPFLRQAASVLMMSSAICCDPVVSDEICPDLPKLLVLKILSNQQPDDFNPMPNDVMGFVNHYNLGMQQYNPTTYKYQGDFTDIREKISIMKWSETKFSEQILESFSFLRNFSDE